MKMKASIFIYIFLIITTTLSKYSISAAPHYALTSSRQIIPISSSDAQTYLQMPEVVAVGTYSDQVSSTGWIYLTVNTSSQYSDLEQAAMAGYFEGFMAYEYIYDTYINQGPYVRHDPMSPDALQYIANQTAFVRRMIAANPNESFWQLVNITLTQQEGIYEGYLEAVLQKGNDSMFLSFEDFYLLPYSFEVGDVNTRYPAPGFKKEPRIFNEHCSFLLKLVEDDLYVSHTTWFTYTSMFRVWKIYNYGFTNPAIQNHMLAYSSQPGSIESGDDFYILSNNRFVGETTIGSTNFESWNFLHYETVPYFIRINVANLAYDTQETWRDYYFSYRSGTYNNQWLVIDFNNYLNNKNNLSQATDIIWMIEELYEMTSAQDLTQSMLIPQGFVASYNEVYNPILQGYSQNYGNYTNAPRYILFNKYAPNIQSFEDFQLVMRMNNISDSGNYCDAIASRCDLEPSGPGPVGAIDCKATSASMIGNMESYIIAGPTTELTPPFTWNDWPTYDNCSVGMPRTYNFTWENVVPFEYEIDIVA